MSSKGEILPKFSRGWCVLPIIALCTIAWGASANALAQDAVPTVMKFTAPATPWSLEGAWTSNAPPHLVLSMLERGDASSDDSLQLLPHEDAANSPAPKAISRPIGSAVYVNHADQDASGPLVLSSLLSPTDEVRGLTKSRSRGAALPEIQTSDCLYPKGYSLLNDGSPPESFLYGCETYLPPKGWLADDESLTYEAGQAPRALMQLRAGRWSLAVMLAGAAASLAH